MRMETPKDPHSITERLREGLSRVGMAMRIDDWNRSKATGLNPTQLAFLTLLEGRGVDGLGVREIAAHRSHMTDPNIGQRLHGAHDRR